MLIVKPLGNGFVMFDTDTQEPVMQFANRIDALLLAMEVNILVKIDEMDAEKAGTARRQLRRAVLGATS